MKKIITIMMTVVLMLVVAINAGATDVVDEPMTEAVTEAAEMTTEKHDETAEEVETETNTETETSLVEADSELGVLLNGATPEQINQIKEYILYGVSVLPFPDQVRIFVAENLEPLAWLVVGIIIMAAIIDNRRTKKNLSNTMTVTNNNAIEVAEQAQSCVESAVQSMDKVAASVNKAISVSEEKSAAMLELAKDSTEKTLRTMEERGNEILRQAKNSGNEILRQAKESTDAAIKAMTELKERESGLTESEIMMATVLCDLVQNSNLPQWKKDEFTIHLKEGLTKITEVTGHDEA